MKMLGITEKRPLPLFKSRSRFQRDQEHLQQSTQSFLKKEQEKKVVLFLSDVFSEYIEPEVKEAAIELLNHFGYEVKVLSTVGAGASFLSKGFIKQAQRHASQVLDEIKSLSAESTINIVGCEPPEVYCLKHEYIALLPHRKTEIESFSKNVFLADEFVLSVAKLDKQFSLELNNLANEKIFFHPHCHQRAEGELATIELLKLFGFDVQLSDAGCCGMAGTFGFEDEHYELSMQIGELKLLPQIRELEIGSIVASSGAACRIQIRDGAKIEAKHPLILVADLLRRSKYI